MALFQLPVIRATDANGNPLPGAKLYFYRSGTLDLADVYTTSALDVAHASPVVADAGGLFAPIYLDGGITYRMILKTTAGVTVQDVDPYQGTSGGGIASISVTIEDFGGAADWNGTTGTDNIAALEEAIDSFEFAPEGSNATIGPDILFGSGNYYFSETIDLKKIVRLIGTGGGQNNFAGGTRFHFPINTTGIVINRDNTIAGGTAAITTMADGSTIRGIQLCTVAGGTDRTKHGIWLRARANIEYCTIGTLGEPFPGNGIYIQANSGGSGEFHGNANNWRILHCYIEDVGRHGLYVEGTDANAGHCVGFETRKCGGCGILDRSGLGNGYFGVNIAGYANASPLIGRVTHTGRHYQLVDPTAGIGASTTPGTNELIWYDMGTGSSWPTWSGAGTYIPDIPILTYGNSNRCFFAGVYTEGGLCHINYPSISIGGQTSYTRGSGSLAISAAGTNNSVFAAQGVGGHQIYQTDGPGYSTNGAYAYTSIGGQDPTGIASGAYLLLHRRRIDGEVDWLWGWDGKDQRYRFLNQKDIWRVTGKDTVRTFGRTSAVPYTLTVVDFAIRDPADANNERIIRMGSASPTSGEIARGEQVINGSPSAGGAPGWVCTTGGVAGSTAVIKARASLAA